MQKWEYMRGTATDTELDLLGEQGWELVAAVYDPTQELTLLYLKRPVA